MLPDYLSEGLRTVFVGTAAGRKSAAVGHYYAGRGNRFWSVLHEVGLTNELLGPGRDAELPGFGLGLTDLVKQQAGMDRDIDFAVADAAAVLRLVAIWRPQSIAFNGKKSAMQAFGLKSVQFGELVVGNLPSVWVLPSTSGAARSHFDVGVWHAFARFIETETSLHPV